MTEKEKFHKKISFGLGLDKNNIISSFCNLSIPNFLRSKDLKITMNSLSSGELKLTDPKNELKVFKNENKILNQSINILGISYKRIFNNSSLEYSVQRENNDSIQREINDENIIYKISYKNSYINLVNGIKNNLNAFTKAVISFRKEFIYKNMFVDCKYSLGQIMGNAPLTERFFLGEEIKGYKKNSIYPSNIDGRTFVQLSNKIGIIFRDIKCFTFSDLGFCSKEKNIVNAINTLSSCTINRCYPSNMAMSVGLGISSHVKMIDKNISAFVAFPLTENNCEGKIQVGIEADF